MIHVKYIQENITLSVDYLTQPDSFLQARNWLCNALHRVRDSRVLYYKQTTAEIVLGAMPYTQDENHSNGIHGEKYFIIQDMIQKPK